MKDTEPCFHTNNVDKKITVIESKYHPKSWDLKLGAVILITRSITFALAR